MLSGMQAQEAPQIGRTETDFYRNSVQMCIRDRTTERRPSVLEAMREQAAKTEPAKKQPAPSHDKESR